MEHEHGAREQRIASVRGEHQPMASRFRRYQYQCSYCFMPWPCSSVTLAAIRLAVLGVDRRAREFAARRDS